MNLLIISQHFWPEQFRINDIAKRLHERCHNVTVLTGLPNYPAGKIHKGYRKLWPFVVNWHGIKVIRVPIIPRGKASNLQLVLNYLSFMISSTFCSSFKCRENYDAILVFQTSPITQALAAVFLKKTRKIPIYLWVQDLWPQSLLATKKTTNTFIIKLVGKFVKFIYRNSDQILIQSKAFFQHINQDVLAEKIKFYPNTCEEFYLPLSLLPKFKEKYKIPKGFIILFSGNIGSAQSLKTIINAVEKLRDVGNIKWLFVGDGSERQNLIREINRRALNDIVYYMGSKPVDEMPYIISLADLCLVTLNKSPIFSLTVPSKIQSYMACAKPIIAAIDGEAAKIINSSGAGIAVPAENDTKLATAVLKLQSMSVAERTKIGQQGRELFLRDYENSFLISKLEEILGTSQ